MERENIPKDDFDIDTKFEQNTMGDLFHQPPEKSSMPTIAGILLIISGVIALLFWISAFTIDVSMIDISQLQELDPTITVERIQNTFILCATILCVLAIFPILGGILSLKRKLWGITVAFGILGIFTLGFLVVSPILSLVGIILIAISRKEFR